MAVREDSVCVRLAGLDRLRGLAVLLMVADHALLVGGAPNVWRLGPTRAALPLFCLIAGALSGSLSARRVERLAHVGSSGAVAVVLWVWLGLAQLDVLLLLAAGLVVVAVVPARWRWLTMAVAIVQPFTWPDGLAGYELGTVVALLLVGVEVGRDRLDWIGGRLPGWLSWCGRWPLSVYVGHLALLAVLVEVSR